MEVTPAAPQAAMRDPDPLVTGNYTYDEVVKLIKTRGRKYAFICVTHLAIAKDQSDVPEGKIRCLDYYASISVSKKQALKFVSDLYRESMRADYLIECMVSKTSIFIGKTPR